MPTRDYSQGVFGNNEYGVWGYSDASATITATSGFNQRAIRTYGQGNYGSNLFGKWGYTESGAISISSASSLSLTAAVPVDTYSSGEYGYGNYSAGTIRDASVTVNAVATVSATAGYVASGSAVSTGQSSITITPQVVRGGIIPAQATSSLTVLGNVTFTGLPYPINGESTVTAVCNRIVFIDVSNISAQSSTNFSARYKWVDEPNASTTWTEVYKVAA